MIQEEKPVVNFSANDLIFMRLGELDKRMDRLERRIDKLEEKLDTTRKELNERLDKQEDKIEKLADKIDRLASKIEASQSHGQIATISTIAIVSAVIYTLFNALYSLIK